MEQNGKKHTIAALHINTRLLFERLLKDEIETITTYKELSEIIGMDVQNGGRHHLGSARNKLLREHGRVHECVKNVGVKRCNDVEILGVGDAGIKSVRRKMRRTAAKVTSVSDFEGLSKENKDRHNAILTIATFTSDITGSRKRKLIEQKVAEAQRVLPVRKMLEAFSSK